MAHLTSSSRTLLLAKLTECFDLTELQVMCFELGLNWDRLAGDSLDRKIVNLIEYFERRNSVEKLCEKCCVLRPLVPWIDLIQFDTQYGNSEISIEGGGEYYRIIDQAIRFLTAKEYDQANALFRKAIGVESSADAHFYAALSALQGRRPRLLERSVYQYIERSLRMATQLDPECNHAYVLWAIVKEDYEVMNGMYASSPTPLELINVAKSIKTMHVNEILSHVPATNNRFWETLKRLG